MPMRRTGSALLGEDGTIRPTPAARLKSDQAVRSLFFRIREELRDQPRGDTHRTRHRHSVLCEAIDLVDLAVRLQCLSVDDLRTLLKENVQFIAIAEHCLVRALPSRSLFGQFRVSSLAAQFINLLLFICELHDPSRDRLRGYRKKYDVLRLCGGYERRGMAKRAKVYKGSPPALLPLMWERQLNNDPAFQNQATSVVNTIGVPYWIFVYGRRSDPGSHWYLAFDESFTFSRDISQRMCERPPPPDDELPSFAEEVLPFLCNNSALAMIGTPFIRPKPTTIHLWAKGVDISVHNGVTAHFPRYYSGSHLDSLRSHDLSDLDLLLGRERVYEETDVDITDERVASIYAARPKMRDTFTLPIHFEKLPKPRPNDNSLSESEIKQAARLVFSVMHGTYGFPQYTAHNHVRIVVSPWWRGEDTLAQKLGTSPRMVSEDRKYGQKSIKEVVAMVTQTIDASRTISGDEKYLWARFRRELQRQQVGRKKIRNAGNADHFKGGKRN